MKRNIIKQKDSYTITLPIKWVREFKLKEAGIINLDEIDNKLIISAEGIKEKKQAKINITKENESDLKVILTHMYRKGYDKIIIEIHNNILSKIEQIVNDYLLGFEVVEKTKNGCIIENITEPTEEKYNTLIRRIFLIIKETSSLVLEEFSSEKFSNLPKIKSYVLNQDKFILFCKRIISKKLFSKSSPIINWELLTFLMHIEHAYYYLYKYAAENKIKKNSKITELLNNLKDYFELYYDAYFKKDINLIHKINNLKNEFQFGKCYKYLEKAKGKENIIFSHIREIFRIIQIGSSPILSELFEEKFT